MSPPLAAGDPDWETLNALLSLGFEWTARAEEQRAIELGIPRRFPAEDFIATWVRARGAMGPINRTQWGPKDIYPNQVNYEIRGTFDERSIYVKFCIVPSRAYRQVLRITSFKRGADVH